MYNMQINDHTCLFHCNNTCRVPRMMLNTRPIGLVFKQHPRDPANVNAWKNMCDPYSMYIVWFRQIWYWDDHLWKRVNRYFGHILVTLFCPENAEISIWKKAYLETVLIRICKWSKRRDPDNFPRFPPQELCAWEINEIVLNNLRLETLSICGSMLACTPFAIR